jgi:proteic killer suppression protein
MIGSWKDRELERLFKTGRSRRIDPRLQKRCINRLTTLDAAPRGDLRSLYQPGYELHPWEGYANRWSISVSGPWRILFNWIDGEAKDVELYNPHG